MYTGLLLSFWHGFHFIFIVNLYIYQNAFLSIPVNIVSWLGKTILMPNYWPSRSVLRWMSVVRNREIRIKHGVTQYFRFTVDMFFVLDFFICTYDWKNYCIGYLYTQTSQIYCFCRVHKILQWIGSSDFKSHQ